MFVELAVGWILLTSWTDVSVDLPWSPSFDWFFIFALLEQSIWTFALVLIIGVVVFRQTWPFFLKWEIFIFVSINIKSWYQRLGLFGFFKSFKSPLIWLRIFRYKAVSRFVRRTVLFCLFFFRGCLIFVDVRQKAADLMVNFFEIANLGTKL
jgi:hypothetical protein